MKKYRKKSPVVLISLQTPDLSDSDVNRSLREISMLISDLNMDVLKTVVQKREHKNASSYLGEGKLKEVAAITGGTGIVAKGPSKVDLLESDLKVVVDDELSPGQQRNLESAFGVEVIDRVSVILQIFENRAKTKEAKLQVELAKLEYQLPRVKDDHSLSDKEGGGGRASRGHTNVELAKQRIRRKISALKREIDGIAPESERELDFMVALVGYTNAGKSSIMHALTKEGVYVEDKLFATLGTTTRKLNPPAVPAIYMTDTVGFLERLPHELVISFRSTLAEARNAWLLLQVIDVSDSDWKNHVRVTSEVLRDVQMEQKSRWLVFNKVDRISADERQKLSSEFPGALFVNALSAEDMSLLRDKIVQHQISDLTECRLVLNYQEYQVLAELRDFIHVVEEEYTETINVVVQSTSKMISKLKAQLKTTDD